MSTMAFDLRPGVIAVNGTIVSRDDIAREAQNHPSSKPFESWRAAARALVIRELLLQEARRSNIAAEPAVDDDGRRETEDEALIRELIESQVKAPQSDETARRRYYEQNRARFRSAALFEAAHILLPAAAGDRAGRGQQLELARLLLSELAHAPEKFPELARAHSACPSATQGGNLGQIGPGQTVPEFESALAAMEPGSISRQPVESRYGFHIIRLGRKIEGKDLPLELVDDRIAEYLTDRAYHDALYSYIRWLAIHATITGLDLETGKIDAAVVTPPSADARHAAMRRFANSATSEDWTSLIGTVQNADDPGLAMTARMTEWRPVASADARPKTLFTFGKREDVDASGPSS
jgi:peptidyl-prolyl cis-trans isomerase C